MFFFFFNLSLSTSFSLVILTVHSASPLKWLLAGYVAADSITDVVAPQGSYVLKNHMGLYCVQLYSTFSQ